MSAHLLLALSPHASVKVALSQISAGVVIASLYHLQGLQNYPPSCSPVPWPNITRPALSPCPGFNPTHPARARVGLEVEQVVGTGGTTTTASAPSSPAASGGTPVATAPWAGSPRRGTGSPGQGAQCCRWGRIRCRCMPWRPLWLGAVGGGVIRATSAQAGMGLACQVEC